MASEPDAQALAVAVAGVTGGEVKRDARFGTASLRLPDRLKIDFATARTEAYSHPGALPEVERHGEEAGADGLIEQRGGGADLRARARIVEQAEAHVAVIGDRRAVFQELALIGEGRAQRQRRRLRAGQLRSRAFGRQQASHQ